MKVLFFVLNNVNKLEDLLIQLSNRGLRGATIINSTGMAQSLYGTNSLMMDSLKVLLNPGSEENRTIFTIVDDEQEKMFYEVVNEVIGPLSKPNTGIIFTLPIDSFNGLVPKKSQDK